MKITIVQLNPVIGDIDGNLARILEVLPKCRQEGADLAVFPEMALTGYPPRDFLERPRFVERVQSAVDEIAKASDGWDETGILFGAPLPSKQATGRGLYNSAVLVHRGRVEAIRHKSLLPTYDVFDEARYFDRAPEIRAVTFKGETLGITVCEDAWNDPELWDRCKYDTDPVGVLAEQGASILINISASPFYLGKERLRYRIISSHAKKHGMAAVFVNQVGGNDELVFDGRSMALDRRGRPLAVFPAFQEHAQTLDVGNQESASAAYETLEEMESLHGALVLGVRDYLRKCGFSKAVLGLSGGIDSAVVCCLAAEALGRDRVLAVLMPSQYSSSGSVEDARRLVENLGVASKTIPIMPAYDALTRSLQAHFEGKAPDVTEENIQARIRGLILMGLSNKHGHLLLSTGNKSEMAVGYCTLYGDMCGGLSVISDVPKTMVYRLARYINRHGEIIPEETLAKPPSAELRPGQKDQDSLPPYDVLDRILHLYIDEGRSPGDITAMEGMDPDVVRWVTRAVDHNEYKRRQAAPGLKVTTKAFGMGRRMVIAASYE